MSDLNFDKYPSCLSWQVLNKNRERMSDRTYSILYWPCGFTIKPCLFLRLSAKLFVLLGLISGCNESSGISVLSYTTMLPYMSIFECASCLEA